jgi:cytochrome c oxidase subunit II
MAVTALATDTRATYEDVATVYAPIAAAVFVIVVGAIGFLVWRGRRRATPATTPRERPIAEAVYVGGLAVIVAVLVTVTFTAQGKIDAAAKEPGLAVDVVAAKWDWRFIYPGTGVVRTGSAGSPATLVVPAGREIRFSATSHDVLHGFYIPERRFQRTLVPERQAHFSIVFPRTGTLDSGVCSFFCGLGHADMRFQVQVLSPAAFDAWLRARRSEA